MSYDVVAMDVNWNDYAGTCGRCNGLLQQGRIDMRGSDRVDEAIGGYIEAENKIAANSRLRRDDEHPASLSGRTPKGQAHDAQTASMSSHAAPSDAKDGGGQTLIEGLARVLFESRYPFSWEIASKRVLNENLYAEAWQCRKDSQAAILYMQQHVRPLVEAAGDASRYYREQNDMQWGYMEALDDALSSLPPALRFSQ